MNRNYKVIWNSSLNCFMAVAEYAKSRGKSSGGAVTSSTKVSSGSVVANSVNILRWSAVCTGLIAAGFSMPSMAGAVDGGSVYLDCKPSNDLGTRAAGSANQSVAVGAFACAPGDQSVAVGANTHAKGNSSVAIGGDDLDRVANGTSGTVAAGTTNEAFNTTATAKQFKTLTGQYLVNVQGGKQYISTVAGDSSVAVGVMSSANASLSLAFGTRSEANVNSATALGTGATASKAGAIALGAGSLTDGTATKIEQSTVNGVDFVGFKGTNAFAGTALDAGRQVSVGSIGNERQIKNVAPGELSATSTDAINGSQIYAVSSKLIDNINAVKTTTDAVVAGTAGLVKQANGTAPITVGAQTGGTSVSFANSANVDRQLKGVAAGTNTNDAVNVGQLNTLANQTFKIQANNDTASAVKSSDTVKFKNGSNVEITRSGNDITIATSSNPSFTTVTSTGAISAGSLNTGGALTVAGIATLNGGANLNNNKISGLAIGTELTDATNVGQLQAATNGVTNTAPVVYSKADGTQVYKVGNAFFDNAAGTGTAVANLDIITSIRSADGSTTRTTKLRNVAAGSIATNSTEAINGSQLNNIAQGNRTLLGGAAAVDVNGVVTSTNIGGTSASTIDGAISAANTQANKELTFTGNVLSDTGTNGSQQKLGSTLNISGGAATTATSSNANIKTVITDGKVDIQIVDAPTFTGQVKANGFDANSQKIVNVANGATMSGSKDAINGGQLNTAAGSIASHLGGGATYNATTGAITAPSYQLDKGTVTATNVGGALTNLDGRISTNTDNIGINTGNIIKAKTTVTKGDNIEVSSSTNTDGSTNYQVATAKNLTVDSIKAGNSTLNSSGVIITDGTKTTTVSSAGTNVTDGINSSTYGANGLSITGGPSITTTGIDAGNKKITGVLAGSTATDAVNYEQLSATNANVATNTINIADNSKRSTGNLTALGGGAKYDVATDTYTAPTYALNDGTESFNTVGGALGNLDTRTTKNTGDIAANAGNIIKAKSTVSQGENILVTETKDSVTGASNYEVKTARALNLDSVTTGNSKLDTAGLTITGGPSVTTTGIDAGNKKITGVLAGSTATDAVNYEQLTGLATVGNDKINQLGGNSASHLGGGATYNATTGAITAPSYQLDKGTVTATNVGGALTNLDGRISTNTDNIGINTGNIIKAKTTVTKGDNIEVSSSTNTDGSTNYQVATAKNLTVDSIKAGNSTLNSSGVIITDGTKTTTVSSAGTNVTDGINSSTYGANGLSITGGPSITTTGIDAGNKKITGVLAGEDATDAVNKSQLDAITGNITAGGVQYDRNTDNTVNYDRVSFAGAPAVIGKDKNDNNIVVRGGTTLTNIANGINAADAVNKGQLDNVTKVKIFDKNGDEITVNIADQIVNNNVNNEDLDSLFLTYNVRGQGVTDRLTIGETVQKMNTEGVKFSHTNGVAPPVGDALTNDSSAGGDNSTAIGVNAIITRNGESSIALGHNTRVEGASSVAIGNGSQANGNQSIAIGTGNIVNGDNSGAFGDPNIIDGSSSYSVGNNNNIDSDDTFVLGNNVIQTVAGSVVLGSESGTTTKGGIIGYLANINDINDLILATRSNRGAVAVGNAEAGIYRQITGVAAGTADSDAVNVSQLKAVNAKIDNIGGSNTTLNDAAVQYDKKDGNINKGNITLAGTSVSTGTGNNGNTVVTSGGTTITNVANGLNVSDAVNKGQLDSLGGGVAGIIGGGAKYENGKLVAGSNGIGNTGESTIHDAIASINNGNAQANESIKANTDSIKTNANNIKANNDSIKANTDDIKANTNRLNSGLSFGADSGNDINKSVGDSTALKFEGGNNITTTATGNGIKFDLNGNISVDSVTTGNTTINNKGVIIKDGPSMTVDGIYAGDKTITGVADGIEVKDAVNFGQLNALDKRLGNSINELGYKINEVEDDANAGISAAMAMSSLPQAYIPGKSMVGGGIATYNGQSAVAVGVSKVSDNGRWVIKANGTADTQGNAGGAIGAGFHF